MMREKKERKKLNNWHGALAQAVHASEQRSERTEKNIKMSLAARDEVKRYKLLNTS